VDEIPQSFPASLFREKGRQDKKTLKIKKQERKVRAMARALHLLVPQLKSRRNYPSFDLNPKKKGGETIEKGDYLSSCSQLASGWCSSGHRR
jgi:hypothetical protein